MSEAENKNNALMTLEQPKKRGRPPGSRNKPKEPTVPNFIPDFLQNVKIPEVQEPIIKDGLPNLPEGKLMGRPMGKKNSGPRKPRAPIQPMSEVETPLDLLGGGDLITAD